MQWYMYNKAGSTDPGSVWNCIRCELDERGEGMLACRKRYGVASRKVEALWAVGKRVQVPYSRQVPKYKFQDKQGITMFSDLITKQKQGLKRMWPVSTTSGLRTNTYNQDISIYRIL